MISLLFYDARKLLNGFLRYNNDSRKITRIKEKWKWKVVLGGFLLKKDIFSSLSIKKQGKKIKFYY